MWDERHCCATFGNYNLPQFPGSGGGRRPNQAADQAVVAGLGIGGRITALRGAVYKSEAKPGIY